MLENDENVSLFNNYFLEFEGYAFTLQAHIQFIECI